MENTNSNLENVDTKGVALAKPDAPETLDSRTPEQKLKDAYKALERLKKLRKTKHRNKNPGAFGGAHPGIKRKKKHARWLSRNTI